MKTLSYLVLTALLVSPLSWAQPTPSPCPDFLNTEVRLLHSEERINLCRQFGGQPLLLVNTASHCGFTYQFQALEQLHQLYQAQGLAVIGFPSGDFRQEADSESETAKVCYVNYGVSFTMTAPVQVKGVEAHKVFRFLNQEAGAPGWNFTKYVVSADGKTVIRLPSRIEPDSPAMHQAIRRVM